MIDINKQSIRKKNKTLQDKSVVARPGTDTTAIKSEEAGSRPHDRRPSLLQTLSTSKINGGTSNYIRLVKIASKKYQKATS